MGENCDFSYNNHGMVVCARWAGLSTLEALEFTHNEAKKPIAEGHIRYKSFHTYLRLTVAVTYQNWTDKDKKITGLCFSPIFNCLVLETL